MLQTSFEKLVKRAFGDLPLDLVGPDVGRLSHLSSHVEFEVFTSSYNNQCDRNRRRVHSSGV